MLEPMQLSTGGRFEARLLEQNPRGAQYEVELRTPDGRWSAHATVSSADGGVHIGDWSEPGAPPDWLLHYLQAGLRSAFRSHGDGGWPRRLTRWRDRREPQGAGARG